MYIFNLKKYTRLLSIILIYIVYICIYLEHLLPTPLSVNNVYILVYIYTRSPLFNLLYHTSMENDHDFWEGTITYRIHVRGEDSTPGCRASPCVAPALVRAPTQRCECFASLGIALCINNIPGYVLLLNFDKELPNRNGWNL